MKAVIIAGSPGTTILPLANYFPKLAFPVANQTLAGHLLAVLQNNNINDIAIISSGDSTLEEVINDSLGNCSSSKAVNLQYLTEQKPMGTAGCLKLATDFVNDEPFLVITANIFLGDLDLAAILASHQQKKSAVTVALSQYKNGRNGLDNIVIDESGQIKKCFKLHHSSDKRRLFAVNGLYVFNPEVLHEIPANDYMDIQEQLIPRLSDNGLSVCAYEINGSIKMIHDLPDYCRLQKELLYNGYLNKEGKHGSLTEVMDRVWVGENVRISNKAYLLGPLVIGDNCTIGDNAQIIGPSSIGNGSKVEENVLVRESIIWKNTLLMNNARIEHCIVTDGSTVPEDERIAHVAVLQDKKYHQAFDFALLDSTYDVKAVEDKTLGQNGAIAAIDFSAFHFRLYQHCKRAFDLLATLLGLLFLLPFFIIIAVLIKLDSKGPVLFTQRRCGRNGKEFAMYKFRTMNDNACDMQDSLKVHNDVDGPVFKIVNDPRVTRVGRFLRISSLDELPQLINVIRGEMSLVGPRPLVMDEMQFSPSWRDIRLKVKPGMTGLWQVSGRSSMKFDGWITHDIEYAKKQSLLFDIKILLKTFQVVAKRIGAF